MAGLATEGLAGFEYDPRSLRDPRLSWSIPFPPNQNHNNSPITPQQHGANSRATKRSTTPLRHTGQVYDQAIRSQHGLPSQLPTATHTYHGLSMNPLHDYRPRSQGQCQPYDQSMLQAQSIGTQLHGHSNAYGQPMDPVQNDFVTQDPTSLNSIQTEWPLAEDAPEDDHFTLNTNYTPPTLRRDLNRHTIPISPARTYLSPARWTARRSIGTNFQTPTF